jgi:hypothetical protein
MRYLYYARKLDLIGLMIVYVTLFVVRSYKTPGNALQGEDDLILWMQDVFSLLLLMSVMEFALNTLKFIEYFRKSAEIISQANTAAFKFGIILFIIVFAFSRFYVKK